MSLPRLQKTWTITHQELPTGGGTAASGRTAASAFWSAIFAALDSCGWRQIRVGPGQGMETTSPENNRWSLHSMPHGGQLLLACTHLYLGTLKVNGSPGGLFTGGDEDTPPTAADVVDWGSLGLPNAPSPYTQAFSASIHLWKASDGAFRLLWGFNGAFKSGFIYDPIARPSAGWTTPCHFVVVETPSVLSRATLAAATNTRHSMLRGGKWYRCGFADVDHGSLGSAMTMTVPNAISGRWPMYPIGIFQRYSTPDSGALGAYHGYVPDTWFGSEAVPTYTTYPEDGSRQFLQLESYILPWDGSPTTGLGVAPALAGEVIGETVPETWGPANKVKPVISNLAPPPGELGRDEAISFDVTDDEGVRRVTLFIEMEGSPEPEIVFRNGEFGTRYAAGSTVTAIERGFHFVVKRTGGWKAAPTLSIEPIDISGNEAE